MRRRLRRRGRIGMAQALVRTGSLIEGAVYGVILNTRAELEARGPSFGEKPYNAPPRAPVLYIKPPNTYAGDGAAVAVPQGMDALEVSPTLAVVIGRTATRVAEDEALDYVAGYTAAIDVSVPHAEVFRPAITQRCRDGFLPIGEAAVAADPSALEVRVRVNGADAGGFSTRDLVRPVARLIAEVTDFMTLYAGDILLAGLPYPAPLARAGDIVEAEVVGVGRVSCRLVRDEGAEA